MRREAPSLPHCLKIIIKALAYTVGTDKGQPKPSTATRTEAPDVDDNEEVHTHRITLEKEGSAAVVKSLNLLHSRGGIPQLELL